MYPLSTVKIHLEQQKISFSGYDWRQGTGGHPKIRLLTKIVYTSKPVKKRHSEYLTSTLENCNIQLDSWY